MFLPTIDDTGSALLEAFEQRLHLDPDTDLTDFLPAAGSAESLAVATELARIDMEYAWRRGSPRRPEYYFAAIPGLKESRAIVAALTFEDYRIRKLAGRPVHPDQYAIRYGISVTGWPLDPAEDDDSPDPLLESECVLTPPPIKSVDQLRTAIVNLPSDTSVRANSSNVPHSTPSAGSNSASAERQVTDRVDPLAVPKQPASAVMLPDIGTFFLGFELLEELGRGTFGRVYLARQEGLAGRMVALKVARGLFGESQTLAQLQHTNIVPIYSMHDAGAIQAVCMPYFGRCTLAQILAGIRDRGITPTTGEHLIGTVRHNKTLTRPELGTVIVNPAPSDLIPLPEVEPQLAPASNHEAGEQVWAKIAELTYTDAVVWVGSQLAAGLAHAHERGILHRDLKPANVILTDDGVPMLLDFNIAEDTKLRGRTFSAVVGGTLPYMAPEQMTGYGGTPTTLDGRADVYSLGVMLFELLTGRRPFVDLTGEQSDVIRRMLAERADGPPSIRAFNPRVPASVESIVRKCLESDPGRRYQNARELHDDLTRHLADQPLQHATEPSLRERVRKWSRRHPRLASSSSVAAVAVLLVALLAGGLYAARERSRTLEARVALDDHARDLTALHELLDDRNQTRESLERSIGLCLASLTRYDIPTEASEIPSDWQRSRLIAYLPESEQARLRDDFGEVFYMMAKAAARRADLASDSEERAKHLADASRWNRLAEGYGSERIPRAVREQRADLARLSGQTDVATRWSTEAVATPPGSPRDYYLVGYWHHHQGRFRQAAVDLEAATVTDPSSFSAWFVRGSNHLTMEQNDLAAMCFTACVALRADFAPVWINRGIALARLKKFELAMADYERAARLEPDSVDVHLLRAGLFQTQGKHAEAIAEFTAALQSPQCPSRVYFYRSMSRQHSGDRAGSLADEAEGLKENPTDELSWTARAEAKLLHGDVRGALADAEQALRVNPRSLPAMQLKAHLLSEKLDDVPGAVRVLDRGVELYPDSVALKAGRGVLRARTGDRDGAIRDAEAALLLDTGGPNLYQVGCIYALTAKTHAADRFRAFELIAAALRAGFGSDYLVNDPDLDAIRRYPEFQKLTPPR